MRRNKLSKIIIRGYKSIAYDLPVEVNLQDVTILLGPNGAGKSNILSFFKMLGFMMSSALQLYVEQEGTSKYLLHYGSQKTDKLSGELVYETGNFKDTYAFTLSHAMEGQLIFTDERVSCHGRSHTRPYEVKLSPNYRESALVDNQDNKAKVVKLNLSKTKFYQFHDSSARGALRQVSSVDGAQYLQSQATNLASFLYYLKENYPANFREIELYVSRVVPSFRSFYLEPSNGYVGLKWYDTSGTDYVFTADQLSDGSIRFIALATLLLQPQETIASVIIIDEPELGLHPMAIGELAHLIKAATRKAQVIVSTQSKDLVDYFEPEQIVVVEKDESKNATLAKQLSTAELGEWLDHYTLSELWDKNVIGGKP